MNHHPPGEPGCTASLPLGAQVCDEKPGSTFSHRIEGVFPRGPVITHDSFYPQKKPIKLAAVGRDLWKLLNSLSLE